MLMLRRSITELKRRRERQKVPPGIAQDRTRAGVAIAAIVKDESRYLDEWIAFHRLIGISHFYIYDNGGDGAFTAGARPSQDVVSIIPWLTSLVGISPQVAAYCHALVNFGARHRWMAFIDVDEFLFPLQAGSLMEALTEFGDLPGVAVPWSMFGTSGHVTPPNDLVIASCGASIGCSRSGRVG
jgi:Glycosyltransferase family 92